jgi:hypothetical protein
MKSCRRLRLKAFLCAGGACRTQKASQQCAPQHSVEQPRAACPKQPTDAQRPASAGAAGGGSGGGPGSGSGGGPGSGRKAGKQSFVVVTFVVVLVIRRQPSGRKEGVCPGQAEKQMTGQTNTAIFEHVTIFEHVSLINKSLHLLLALLLAPARLSQWPAWPAPVDFPPCARTLGASSAPSVESQLPAVRAHQHQQSSPCQRTAEQTNTHTHTHTQHKTATKVELERRPR